MEPKQVAKDIEELVDESSTASVSGEVTKIGRDTSVDEQFLDALDEMASSFDVTGFKCQSCGLVHGHSTVKHQLGDTFGLGADDAAEATEYNSTCHCGVNEAELRGSDFGVDEGEAGRIASSAPIPDGERRAMQKQFSS